MTLDRLIEMLEDYREELGGDAEVRLMTQQQWPFENTIAGVVSDAEMTEEEDEDEDEDEEDENDEAVAGVVYLVEGKQLGYGSKAAWDCARYY